MVRNTYVGLLKKGKAVVKYIVNNNLIWSKFKNIFIHFNNHAIFVCIIADLAALICLYIDRKWVRFLVIFICLILKVTLLLTIKK